jgi:hypothetical protein
MYKLPSIFFLYLLCGLCTLNAQTRKEAGFFAGTSYYIGDINPTRQFYKPSPAFGGLMKFYFNNRHCLRFTATYGQLRGSDKDFTNQFQIERNASFFATLVDIGFGYEFNFLPFNFDPRVKAFSPFLFGGLGYDFPISSPYLVSPHFSIPFGMGAKYMLSRKVTIGAEWSFRKTFQDNIDGVTSPGGQSENANLSNKDWYSFAGIFITFRLFDNYGDCPVYLQK